jgi:hypothetical protein
VIRLAALLTLCMACSFDASVKSGNAPSDDGGLATGRDGSASDDAGIPIGSFRKSIEINAKGLTADLSDFVVAVLLAGDIDLMARAEPDGSDIHFVSSTGEPLEFEIEEFIAEKGKLVAWVKVPTIPIAGPSTIYLYYGGTPVAHDPMLTWSGGFAGAWHLAEDPTATMPVFSNSVSGTLPATATGDARPSAADGIAGPGLSFDGINHNLLIADSGNSDLDFGTTSFSYSTWVFVTDVVGSFDMPWWKGGASAGNQGYDLELGTNNWTAYISDGGGSSGDIVGATFGNLAEFQNRWVHLVAVVNREAGELQVFSDGVRKATRDISALGSLSTSTTARLSRPAYIFKGLIDESRVYNVPLSDEWVRTEHANISSPTTFLTLGPEEGAAPN